MSSVDSLGNSPDRGSSRSARARARRRAASGATADAGTNADDAAAAPVDAASRPFNDALEAAQPAAGALAAEPSANQDGAALERLLDELHTAGDALGRATGLSNVQRYKRAVRAFVAYVVENALGVERATSPDSMTRRKKYLVISVVDAKLERLAGAVMSNQVDRLQLVERIEEINGLLVDLVS